jgi:TetR/AcrR family transcriptional repressor of mexJK operon
VADQPSAGISKQLERLPTERLPEEAKRSRGRPRLDDVAEIENSLLAVALGEFLEHGYGGTSMSRVVKAAGISKTTLYSRYPSKEQLFRAVIHRQVARLEAASALRPGSGRLDLRAGLIAYGNRTLEVSLEGEVRKINHLIYSESSRFPEVGCAATERTQHGIAQVSAFIRECAELDGVPCTDPEAPAQAFIYMMRGWYVSVLLTGQPVPVSKRQSWVTSAVDVLLSSRTGW